MIYAVLATAVVVLNAVGVLHWPIWGVYAYLGAILVATVVTAAINLARRRRYYIGRRARFRTSDDVLHEGRIVGFGKDERLRVQDSSGTVYEVRRGQITVLSDGQTSPPSPPLQQQPMPTGRAEVRHPPRPERSPAETTERATTKPISRRVLIFAGVATAIALIAGAGIFLLARDRGDDGMKPRVSPVRAEFEAGFRDGAPPSISDAELDCALADLRETVTDRQIASDEGVPQAAIDHAIAACAP